MNEPDFWRQTLNLTAKTHTFRDCSPIVLDGIHEQKNLKKTCAEE